MYRFISKRKVNGYFYLEDDELHHAKVRRIKLGDKVEINDLNGNIYLTEVIEIKKRYIKLKEIEQLNHKDLDIKITLYQVIPNRPSKIDDLIEPISELGVYKFVPVISKYTSIKEKEILKKIPKWEKLALNSIKQCKRLFPVRIGNPVKLENLQDKSELKIVFYEKEKDLNLKIFYGKEYKDISILIGAEGGFNENEIELLKKRGFISCGLSQNILRMETAIISAVCQVMFVFGK